MIGRFALRCAGVLCSAVLVAAFTGTALAATPSVPLGTADGFAVLAGSTITNTGGSVVNGDLGLHPGTAVTGFPPGTVNGSQHRTDAVAAQAKADLVIAYNDAAGRPLSAASPPDIGGQTLTAGVYKTGSVPALELTGDVTLDAQGDPRAVFIFQAESTLITATDSSVRLINGARACNVFWQVGSSATLGTRTAFKGTVMAMTSISVNDGVRIEGRLLARNGAVTLINDTINRSQCATGSDGDSSGDAKTGDATAAGDGTGGGTATNDTGGGSTTTTGTGGGSTTTTGTTVAARDGTEGHADTAGGTGTGTGAGDGRTTTSGGGSRAGAPSRDASSGPGGGDTGGGTGGGTATGDSGGDGASADDALGATIPFTGLDIRFLGLGLVLILLGVGLRAGPWGHRTKT